MRSSYVIAAAAAAMGVGATPTIAAIPTFRYEGTISGDAGSYAYIPVPGPYYGKPVTVSFYFSAPSDGIVGNVWGFESYNDTCIIHSVPYYCGGNDYEFSAGYGEAPSGSQSLVFTYYDVGGFYRTRTDYGYRDTYLELLGGNISYRFLTSGDVAYSILATTGVPEPAAWAFLILGFGAIGGAMRRRRMVTAQVRLT